MVAELRLLAGPMTHVVILVDFLLETSAEPPSPPPPMIKDNVLNMSSSVLSSPAQKTKSGDALWTILLTSSPLLVPEGRTSKFFFPEMTSMFLCLSSTNSRFAKHSLAWNSLGTKRGVISNGVVGVPKIRIRKTIMPGEGGSLVLDEGSNGSFCKVLKHR